MSPDLSCIAASASKSMFYILPVTYLALANSTNINIVMIAYLDDVDSFIICSAVA